MAAAADDLPEDIDALKAALLAERDRAARVAAELAVAQAKASPSGVSRLSRLGGMRDGSVFTAVMRSVHKFSYGHKFERSAATPVVA